MRLKTDVSAANPDVVKDLRSKYDTYAKAAIPAKNKPRGKDFVCPKVWGEK